MNRVANVLLGTFLILTAASGCRSPYYADRGALFGGLAGAGVGAAIGDSSGNALPGAVIGSAVGAITGAAVGDAIDEDLARSKAEIEARMGRQMVGAVTPEDVINMTRAGLSEGVIVTHIRANGVARVLQVNDLIYLRNAGVADSVIQTLQSTPPAGAVPATVVTGPPPGAVIVEHHYGPPPPPPPSFFFHYGRPWRPPHRHGRVGWGLSFSN